MKTLLLIVLATFSTTVGEVLLAKGMKEVGDVSQLHWTELWKMTRMFANPKVLLGVTCMAIFFFGYAASLSWAELSLVLPTTAFSIVFATTIASFWLGEQVSTMRWVGVVVIMLGIMVIWVDQAKAATVRRPVASVAPAEAADAPLRRAAGE
jgi:multidrug transporter EmrE-like cation transporter